VGRGVTVLVILMMIAGGFVLIALLLAWACEVVASRL